VRNNDTQTDSCTDTAEGQSIYGRWSRRKQRSREEQTPRDNVNVSVDDAGPNDNVTATPQPPALTDADMPSLESLHADSDYSGFLSTGVSDQLRNKALRKLFHSAQFNRVDGLDDYAEDFTNFDVLGDIVTSDMHYERELEAQRLAEREQQDAESVEAHADAKIGESAQADAVIDTDTDTVEEQTVACEQATHNTHHTRESTQKRLADNSQDAAVIEQTDQQADPLT